MEATHVPNQCVHTGFNYALSFRTYSDIYDYGRGVGPRLVRDNRHCKSLQPNWHIATQARNTGNYSSSRIGARSRSDQSVFGSARRRDDAHAKRNRTTTPTPRTHARTHIANDNVPRQTSLINRQCDTAVVRVCQYVNLNSIARNWGWMHAFCGLSLICLANHETTHKTAKLSN